MCRGCPPLTAEPRGAERVGNGKRRVPRQERPCSTRARCLAPIRASASAMAPRAIRASSAAAASPEIREQVIESSKSTGEQNISVK
jgi:hypothetical protein